MPAVSSPMYRNVQPVTTVTVHLLLKYAQLDTAKYDKLNL